jgi:hypothetical protein
VLRGNHQLTRAQCGKYLGSKSLGTTLQKELPEPDFDGGFPNGHNRQNQLIGALESRSHG